MKYKVFGEIKNINTDSLFNHANELALINMKLLGKDDEFKDINQADILNLSLGFFNVCIEQFDNPDMAENLRKVLDDYLEFKAFGLLLIGDGKRRNESMNEGLLRLAIEREKEGMNQ